MMTRSHCYWFSGIITIYFSLLFHSIASPTLHLCHHDQRDALLEFKDEFPIAKFKPSPWNKSSDCCFWEGVMCDDRSGQVISLNFSRTFLTGSLKTNSSLFKLQSLRHLILLDCHLQGEIPSSLGNLSRLTYVDLSYNKLLGEIPASIGNLNRLRYLSLGDNNLTGEIPSSLVNLSRLTHVDFFYNKLVGEIPASICNLNQLEDLYLSHNNLIGEVPSCLWRLTSVSLNHNSFSSLEKISQDSSIKVLLLDSNSFRGPFAPWICKLKWLIRLDLSDNLFSGSIPSCLRNVIDTFVELILRNNNFNGTLPDVFSNATKLELLDVGGNQLEGNLPRSLINCKALEHVNVGSNKIKDTFPSWLGSLPSLHVLALRSNEFYGPLYHRNVSIGFQSLRIIDISHNGFTGTLPPHYFSSWREMTTLTTDWSEYMVGSFNATYGVYNSMEMVNKGVEMSFEHIRKDFRAIDFSRNRIYGKIPESVGFLKELRLLNLSGNAFTSDIPRFLANLTKLETLDLSRNKLSGQIPQDLDKLSFLSYMNFSHNRLQGPVPRGTQFQRQNCSSFSHNPRLYGLEDTCEEKHVSDPTSQQPEELSEAEEQMFNWVAAAIAYGPGVFCGLVIGYIFTSHNHEWFTEKFGRRKLRVPTSAR